MDVFQGLLSEDKGGLANANCWPSGRRSCIRLTESDSDNEIRAFGSSLLSKRIDNAIRVLPLNNMPHNENIHDEIRALKASYLNMEFIIPPECLQ